MSITIYDPELLAQLMALSGSIDLRSPDGSFVGTFHKPFGKPPAGYQAPITDEELVELRKESTGRPLAEIMRDLRAKA